MFPSLLGGILSQDNTPPVTTLSINGTAGFNGWYQSPVTLQLTATDNFSGVLQTTYRLNGGSEQIYTGPININAEGSYTIEYHSQDVVGNFDDWKTLEFGVDFTTPVTTHTLDGVLGLNDWWTSDMTVTLDATDNVSGPWQTTYRINGGFEEAYSFPLILTADGIYTVDYRTRDFAGNLENWKTIQIKIDTTPPVTTSTLSGEPGLNGWWISDVMATLNATDNLSGVADILYSLDGSAEQPFSIPFTVTGEGIHTLQYRSRDIAGNLEMWDTIEIKIDTVPPVLDISSDQGVYTRVELITFDVVVFDPVPGSGLWRWETIFLGEPIQDGEILDPFWLNLGTFDFEGFAQDYAGWITTDDGSLELIATLESLSPTVSRLCDEGHIVVGQGNGNGGGICNALQAKIRAAINSANRGNSHTAVNQLNAILHQLDAQQGKSLSADAYRLLNQDVEYVIASFSGVVTRQNNVSSPAVANVAPPVGDTSAPVLESNTTPVANNDVASLSEDTSMTIAVLSNDSDLDNDVLVVTQVGSASRGTTILNTDGTVTYIPHANIHGDDSFTYQISDGRGGNAIGIVLLNIQPTNDAPIIASNTTMLTVTAGQVASVNGTYFDIDGDTFTFRASAGTVSDTGNGTWMWTLLANDEHPPTQTILVTVDDLNGGTATTQLSLVIQNQNSNASASTLPNNTTGGESPPNANTSGTSSVPAVNILDEKGLAMSTATIAPADALTLVANIDGVSQGSLLIIDWGDGSQHDVISIPAPSIPIIGSHRYLGVGTFTTSACVTAQGGESVCDWLTVTVEPGPPAHVDPVGQRQNARGTEQSLGRGGENSSQRAD